jgi:hypothetical protein
VLEQLLFRLIFFVRRDSQVKIQFPGRE